MPATAAAATETPNQMPHIRLSDGNSIPQLGMGVWEVDPKITARVVRDGIDAGFRLIDTAEGYDNEAGVGEAIRSCGLPRGELFITSKLRNGGHDRDAALKSFDATMAALGLEQLDMFLIHWPVPAQDKYVEAWRTLVELQKEGRVTSIGVSNFNAEHLERIIGETGVTPVVDQIEMHPYFQQTDKLEMLKHKGIAVECYSPLGHGEVLKDKVVEAIGKAHGKTVAQVVIRWHLQMGHIAIPRSVHAERLRENFDVFDFTLSDDEMRQMAGLDKGEAGRTGSNPATANFTF